jgi:hypothetical protein
LQVERVVIGISTVIFGRDFIFFSGKGLCFMPLIVIYWLDETEFMKPRQTRCLRHAIHFVMEDLWPARCVKNQEKLYYKISSLLLNIKLVSYFLRIIMHILNFNLLDGEMKT